MIGAASLPLYEGVTLCLLTAMSLLAILGLRHPVKLLPLLVVVIAAVTPWRYVWKTYLRAAGDRLR